MMSSADGQRRSLREAAARVWQLGGLRAYYRGLTVSAFCLALIVHTTVDGTSQLDWPHWSLPVSACKPDACSLVSFVFTAIPRST